MAASYGGPVRSLLGYLEAGSTAGLHQTVIAPEPASSDRDWLAPRMMDAEWCFFRSVGAGAFTFAPGLEWWLLRHAADFDLAHVHGLFNPVSSLGARMARMRSVPVVIRPFGTLSRYTFTHRRAWLKERFFSLVDRPNVFAAMAIHFTTVGEKEDAAWHRMTVIDRGVVVPPPYTSHALPRLDQPAGNHVLFLSRLHPVKHVELLIDAWPAVVRAIPDATLTIAGTGEPAYVESVVRRVGLRGADSSIRFVGAVGEESKRTLLVNSRVFVQPSYHENFGMSVLEAIAAGIPVLATREVHLAPFVKEHSLGRIVDRSPGQLALAIVSTLRDRELLATCGRRGPQVVAEHFAPHVIGGRLAEMYRSVLQQRN